MENQAVKLSLKSTNQARALFHWQFISVTIFVLSFVLAGCGASKVVKQNRKFVEEAYQLQKPIQVQTSKDDKRPSWTKKTSYETDEGMMYFTGGFLSGADYSLTIRLANAEALKVAVQSISQFIRAEFTEYVKGSNAPGTSLDRYVEDGIATFVHNLHMQGVRQKEVYYEETFSASVMQPAYNVFVMLEMGKVDYLHAKAEVLRKLRDKFSRAGETEAKEKAQKLLEDLKREASQYGA